MRYYFDSPTRSTGPARRYNERQHQRAGMIRTSGIRMGRRWTSDYDVDSTHHLADKHHAEDEAARGEHDRLCETHLARFGVESYVPSTREGGTLDDLQKINGTTRALDRENEQSEGSREPRNWLAGFCWLVACRSSR